MPPLPSSPSSARGAYLSAAWSFLSAHRLLLLKSAVWLLGWRVFVLLEFGAVYVALTAFALLFANLSSSSSSSSSSASSSSSPAPSGRVSAYSAFNEGGARMAGQMTAAAGAESAKVRTAD